jgi:hypothetical protein
MWLLSEEYPMSVLHEERQLSAEHRRALKLLADVDELGCTGANSFNPWVQRRLVR